MTRGIGPMWLGLAVSMVAGLSERQEESPKPIKATTSGTYPVTLSEDYGAFVARVAASQERERAIQRVEAARAKQQRKAEKRLREAARRGRP